MPILKATDATPERPVVIVIYGDPGVGKTSLSNTAKNPLLIDADRGRDRAILRKDTLVMETWQDVLNEEQAGTFKNYSTITVDTAKAMLDDFLMAHVITKNFKLRTNKLQAYGAIGDEFKIFVNNRRNEQADLVILAHSREIEDGDLKKKSPDVTGGSLSLLMRIADQVGYLSIRNGKRTLVFEPQDNSVGKNVAKIPAIEIPDENDPALKDFMAGIIEKVRKSLTKMSEAQAEAIAKQEELENKISSLESADAINQILPEVKALPKAQATAMAALIRDRAAELKLIFNKTSKLYEPAPTEEKKDPVEEPKAEEVLN